MSKITPRSKPKLSRQKALELLGSWDFSKYPIVVLGIRGYYKNSMGRPLLNDTGIYDDACAIITQTHFKVFNFNTDPSTIAEGRAMLEPGTWHSYKLGLHKNQYLALVQRMGKVKVKRQSKKSPKGYIYTSGFFGINIHKGGTNQTNSLGCQTVPPSQWEDFINTCKVYQEDIGREDKLISYKLIEI